MASLKSLVTKYGYGIRVKSRDCDVREFVILENYSNLKYRVKYDDGIILEVLKECPFTNDYSVVRKSN